MNDRSRFTAAVLVAMAAPAAWAETTAAQAGATFDRIRTTSAELKLHCEQIKLQGDAVRAAMKGEKAAAAKSSARVDEIQGKLAGYKDAMNLVADKAATGGVAYFRSDEGKALEEAQKKLTNSCISVVRK